ncbi:MAG: hypothetical protein KGH62_01950 [Candidatus Micrarchaeota archaeon]|nr:hypothetical protein [Candidatus Micrarchaeota archaeon]
MNFLNNPRIKKSLIVSAFLTLLLLIGFALVQVSNQPLGVNVLTSAAFLTDLVVVAIAAVVYDMWRGQKARFGDAIWGGALSAVALASFAGVVGVSALAPGSLSIGLFVLLAVALWLGFEAAEKVKL